MTETTQFRFHNERSQDVEVVIEPWALVERVPPASTIVFEVNRDPPPEIEFSLTEDGQPYVFVMSEMLRISLDGVVKHEYAVDVRPPSDSFRILRRVVFQPMEKNKGKFWFRRKTYGYGATPNTWQGWLLTVVGLAMVVAAAAYHHRHPDEVWSIGVVVAVLVLFTVIVFFKTEGGWRWQWGKDD